MKGEGEKLIDTLLVQSKLGLAPSLRNKESKPRSFVNKEIAIANAVLQNLPSVNSRTSYNELGCKNKSELVNTYFLWLILTWRKLAKTGENWRKAIKY